MEAVPIKMAARTVQACVFVKMKFLVGVEIESTGGRAVVPSRQHPTILEFQTEEELRAC
jgi:hypothetical protein